MEEFKRTSGFGISRPRPKLDLSLPLKTIAVGNTMSSPAYPGTKSSSLESVYSPVTNLALNLGQLNTESSNDGTPKRRLSPTSENSPTPFKFSTKHCLQFNSSGVDSPSFDLLENKENKPKATSLFHRMHSMPASMYSPCSILEDSQRLNILPTFGLPSPTDKPKSSLPPLVFSTTDDESSQDSGLGCDKEKDDGFQFVEPVGIPPRRQRSMSDETCSPISYSPHKGRRPLTLPPTCLFASSPDVGMTSNSPKAKRQLSVDAGLGDDDDDGFLDLIDFDDEDDMKVANVNVRGFSSLLHAPLLTKNTSSINNENTSTPSRRGLPRGLFRSPSAPKLNTPSCDRIVGRTSKRPEPPIDDSTPVLSKRRKSVCDRGSSPRKLVHKIERCHSESEATIKSAMNRGEEQPDLIGDFSRAYCLPIVPGKHQDLKYITCETLSELIAGKHNHIVEKYFIIDARYPYEFQGGHITGAQNLYLTEEVMKQFMDKIISSEDENKRTVLIFHCEFSSERGPKMSRFLRNMDRSSNKDSYPSLHYPEIYLLEGGYKDFFAVHKEQCEPMEYKPMLHPDHQADLKHFRSKTRSWNSEKRTIFKPRF